MPEAKLHGRRVDREELSDGDALRRVARGEVSALGVVYDRHASAVRRFATRATHCAGDVDDIVQSTFLTAAGAAARFDSDLECRPWLLGIAAKLVSRRHRTLGRLARLIIGAASVAPDHEDPSGRLGARSELRDIDRALGRLSEAKRVTFLLSEVEELSGEQIAVALEIPLGTVWTRLHAARRELREFLAKGVRAK